MRRGWATGAGGRIWGNSAENLSWGALGNSVAPQASLQPTGMFVFPLCLGNTVISILKPICKRSCCCTVSARGKFEKHNHFVSKEAEIQGRRLKLKTQQAYSVSGVCCFSSPLRLPSYCGNLAGVCSLTSNSFKGWIKMKEMFCRKCCVWFFLVFFCKTLLIGFV